MTDLSARIRRAEALITGFPHAAELLRFAIGAWKAQEHVRAEWPDLGENRSSEDRQAAFAELIRRVGPSSPPALAEAANALLTADAAAREAVIDAAVRGNSPTPVADRLAVGTEAVHALGTAFVQALFPNADPPVGDAGAQPRRACPRCGGAPMAGVLRDEAEVKGRRYLVCGRCTGWWPFPRSTCAGCEERDPEQLVSHSDESIPHVRLDACRTCKVYVKTVDQRIDGLADPHADDIASVALDLWAAERGLRRLATNLLLL